MDLDTGGQCLRKKHNIKHYKAATKECRSSTRSSLDEHKGQEVKPINWIFLFLLSQPKTGTPECSRKKPTHLKKSTIYVISFSSLILILIMNFDPILTIFFKIVLSVLTLKYTQSNNKSQSYDVKLCTIVQISKCL